MKLSRAVSGFLLSLAADGYSENTIDLYSWALKILIECLGDPNLAKISSKDMQSFMAWVQDGYRPQNKLAPASIENIWIAIRSFFNWATEELNIVRPDTKIKRPKYRPREIIPFSEDDIRSLLQELKKPGRTHRHRNRAIILALLDTGVRVSELTRIRIADASLDTGAVRIHPYGTGRKTEPRTVYLGSSARKAVWLYLAARADTFDTDPLFLTAQNQMMNRNTIRVMVGRLGDSAGVPHTHPHRFRHTFGIQFLRNGGDVFSLQILLGHSTLEMSKTYAKLAEMDTMRIHQVASPVDRWRL